MSVAFVDAEWPGFGHRTQRWPHKNMHGDINPPPLYQMIAAAAVKADGHQVTLYDAPAQRLSNEQIIRDVLAQKTHAVVVNSSTPSFDHDLAFVKQLRAEGYGGKVMIVGPHVTFFWKETLLSHQEIDFVLRGEYDFTVRNLLRNHWNPESVEGVAWTNDAGEVQLNEAASLVPVDDLPWPDYELVDIHRYNEFLFPITQKPIATISTSRGCPYHCSFCLYPQLMFGHKLRRRSVSSVIAEMNHLKERWKVKFFYFEDDTFTADWKHVESLCRAMIEANLSTPWGCLGRVDGVTLERLKLMRQAGCILIKYGVETGNQAQLNEIGKRISLDEVEEAFKVTVKAGIQTHATVMFGYPGESPQTIEQTHHFLRKIGPDYLQFSLCIPFPGTALYEQCKKKGWLHFDAWEDFDGAWGGVIEGPVLTRQVLREAVRVGYRKYYLRPKYLMKRMYRSVVGPYRWDQILQNIDLIRRFFNRYLLPFRRVGIQ